MRQIQAWLDEGEIEKARKEALHRLNREDDIAGLHYWCAVSHDAQGMEREAIPFYEKAVCKGIQGELRAQAYI